MAADTQLGGSAMAYKFGGMHNSMHMTMQTTHLDQSRIPLVGHIVTDEDIGALQVDRIPLLSQFQSSRIKTPTQSSSSTSRFRIT